MRIKSAFRDYYDGLAASDMEPEPLYIRTTSVKHSKDSYVPIDNFYVIGFAGNLYPVARTTIPGPTDYNGNPFYSYHYNSANYLAELNKTRNKHNFYKYQDEAIELAFGLLAYNWTGNHANCRAELLKYFNEFNTPCFLAHRVSRQGSVGYIDEVQINPRLGSWDFARIVPPYQAWRDLTVYLSNLAHPNPVVPTISNSDMIVAKGFNHPDSFRAVKGESGPARKRRKK